MDCEIVQPVEQSSLVEKADGSTQNEVHFTSSEHQILFVNSQSMDESAITPAQPSTFDDGNENVATIFSILHHQSEAPSCQSASTETKDSDFTMISETSTEFRKDVNLESLLSADVIGQALVQKSKCKSLTNADRDRISDIVVTHCLNKYKKMDHEQFDVLAGNIVKLFSNEKKSTYFIPPIKKSNSSRQKSERARGKLVEKYRNKLHLLKLLSGEINTTARNTTEKTSGIYI